MDSTTTRRRGPGRPPTAEGPRTRMAKTRLRVDEAQRVDALLVHHGYPATELGLREYLLAQAADVPEPQAA